MMSSGSMMKRRKLPLKRCVVCLVVTTAIIFVSSQFVPPHKTPERTKLLNVNVKEDSSCISYGPIHNTAKQAPHSYAVTLATHTSLKNIHKLHQLLENWDGPITVSIWLLGDISLMMALAFDLTRCYTKYQFSITLLTPVGSSYDEEKLKFLESQHTQEVCGQRQLHNRFYKLRAMERTENYDTNVPYPNNKLRNLALHASQTSHVMVIDIDLSPSIDMHAQLLSLLETQSSRKHAYVIPVFETTQHDTNRWNISTLVKHWTAGDVRQFYIEPCPQCQGPTQYSNWKSKALETKQFDYAQSGSLRELIFKPGWEPFLVIQRAHHPEYDERFQRYGYNRLTLIGQSQRSGTSPLNYWLVGDHTYTTPYLPPVSSRLHVDIEPPA